jgi:hypothetical protein
MTRSIESMTLHAIARATAPAAAGLILAACTLNTNPDAARVDCGTPGPNGVDCKVQRTGGTGDFESCWDLVITCQNGGRMTGSACHDMAAGDTEGTRNMPVASFSNQAGCDVPASGKVERLKLTSR